MTDAIKSMLSRENNVTKLEKKTVLCRNYHPLGVPEFEGIFALIGAALVISVLAFLAEWVTRLFHSGAKANTQSQ